MPHASRHSFAFEDIIDGYFPLQVSLGQMMERLGAMQATVEIAHVPIMHIPGLPHSAPVPLNICSGRAGLVEHLALNVALGPNGTRLSGIGVWNWLDGDDSDILLDPMTRLAEPAFLTGQYRFEPLGGSTAGQIRRATEV